VNIAAPRAVVSYSEFRARRERLRRVAAALERPDASQSAETEGAAGAVLETRDVSLRSTPGPSVTICRPGSLPRRQ